MKPTDNYSGPKQAAPLVRLQKKQPSVQFHSQQAMVAARKMRTTKRNDVKRRTGQMVCHHLKMMLSEVEDHGTQSIRRGDLFVPAIAQAYEVSNQNMQIHLGF